MLNRHNVSPADRIAIDLGGFHTRFYSATDGLLLDEPSVGALDMDHQRGGADAVKAFGNIAADKLEVKNDHLKRVQPIQSDRHNDLGLSQKMLSQFITAAKRSGRMQKASQMHLVLPHAIDETYANRLLQTCINSGASDAYWNDAGLAAFHGSSLNRAEPGVLIDFGATGSRLIAVADNEVKSVQTLHCGGDSLDQAIHSGLIAQFDLYVSETDARDIKHRIGAATPQSFVQHARHSMQIDCLSLQSNTTTQFRISSETISDFLAPMLDALGTSIKLAFAGLDSEIKDAAFNNAIQLCGGGALLSRIDQLVMHATDLPVEVTNRPMTCSVRGAAMQLTDLEEPLDLRETV